jgi:hypothetical protein
MLTSADRNAATLRPIEPGKAEPDGVLEVGSVRLRDVRLNELPEYPTLSRFSLIRVLPEVSIILPTRNSSWLMRLGTEFASLPFPESNSPSQVVLPGPEMSQHN